MSRGMTKADRLQEMVWLYLQRAYSDSEMAERLGVDRTTVFRYRTELEIEHVFKEDENGRYRLERMQYMPNIKVNLHEALALYLAARRTSRQTRIAQPHVAGALQKLAVALRQPMTTRLAQAASNILEQSSQPERVSVMEQVTQAWAEQRKLEITYRGLHAQRARDFVVSPYLIEPALWSEGAYLIGPAAQLKPGPVSPQGQAVAAGEKEKLMTFKIERIEKTYIKLENFAISEDFDEAELLRQAWGIWYTEGEPVTVRLRFAPGEATRRMKESVWVQEQVMTDTPDGGCIWQARVSEWQEMLPWVRGWGADVEVLEPRELRDSVIGDVQLMADMYSLKLLQGKTEYYAHSNQWDKSRWQRLSEHLENTARLAVDFGKDARLSDLAYIAALFHDIGKYSLKFQKKLEGKPIKVDHSTAGAKEVKQLFQDSQNEKFISTILAYCITGHHAGLPDHGSPIDVDAEGTLLARLKKDVEDYSPYAQEIDLAKVKLPTRLPIQPIKGCEGFSVAFLTRMLYSTLVDADFQETETFMNEGKKPRGEYEGLQALHQKLTLYLERFQNPENPIHQQRTETLKACIAQANQKPGFYTLTVPTGGGKTLASLAFAMEHAIIHDLKRIIYVIPYTSIIEQNAAVFKACLGDENVLEHHSNFDWGWKVQRKETETAEDKTFNSLEKLKLAAENWDIPIVVTTNVQFFESLYANRSSGCRKLHNIAKSVIIFDEAQMLPREYMRPCLYAVYELVKNYGATAVFCTATQPNVIQFLPEGTTVQELALNPQALYTFYKRVQIKNTGAIPDEALIERMNEHQQALCIVNTRNHARGLFEGLAGEGCYHLSTLMCPAHRKKTIAEIRERLKAGQPCRVVSTQIMEAGIDIDFPIGYRALSGLDSIIQAAGRVNRERKKPVGDLYVFDPDSPLVKRTPAYIQQGADVARSILRQYAEDPMSMEAIQAYFRELYSLHNPQAFDAKMILACFEKGTGNLSFDFKTAAERFKVIEDITTPVIIPYDEQARSLLWQVRASQYPASFSRKLQVYTVNIYEREYQALQALGLIDMYSDCYAVLNDMSHYDAATGLRLPESTRGEAIFFDG